MNDITDEVDGHADEVDDHADLFDGLTGLLTESSFKASRPGYLRAGAWVE